MNIKIYLFVFCDDNKFMLSLIEQSPKQYYVYTCNMYHRHHQMLEENL